ncbi:sugar-binding transcriptional regulator [Fusibacter ferrireducens]|uniref:Sugar-binding transcriptional regulator n=1 Tax=Fusibacter ferrireducens TaxID=2785058 RepID=A0ABR9ZV24_9FIRM|nr:sugar-binding transcriptional regulator [Fusibacter ferrireducens]MBF4694307.1 sugar-binding transcriptional regulator [Fusibacter ferrireducens]
MEKAINDKRLMVRCAQMYYDEGFNQADISEKLGISKSTVSRILNSAIQNGIVKITVVNPYEYKFIEIEHILEKKFGLKEAIIVEVNTDNIEVIKDELAKAGAAYLERIVKSDQIIGVTWGTTVKLIPRYITNTKKNSLTFIPLSGGIGEAMFDLHPNQIAIDFAEKFRANSKVLLAPSMVDDLDRKKLFMEERSINELMKLYDCLDIAVSGIGCPKLNTSTMISSGYYTEEQLQKLVNEGAVADVSNMLIDKNGDGSKFESNSRIIGITLEQFRNAKLTIGIAGGTMKVEAIKAALKGNYLDVLILDLNAAMAIINNLEEE